MDKSREAPRYPIVGERSCSLGVITFKHLEWIDHTVRIMDMSESGVNVESKESIEPGFVWFNDRVSGHKSGVLVWCRTFDERFRAGIRFVPLTRDEERVIQERTVRTARHRPHRSPDQIVTALMESMTRSCGSRSISPSLRNPRVSGS